MKKKKIIKLNDSDLKYIVKCFSGMEPFLKDEVIKKRNVSSTT